MRRFLLDTRLTMIVAPFNTAGVSGSLSYPVLLLWPTCRSCAQARRPSTRTSGKKNKWWAIVDSNH